MSRIKWTTSVLAFLALTIACAVQSATVDADDPRILIVGRCDVSDPKAPVFDWPAVNIRVAVTGSDLAFLLEDAQGTNHFNLTVDGKPVTVVAAKKGLNRIAVPGLGKGHHLVTLSKRTEGFQGAAVFGGLEIGKGTSLAPAPDLPDRKIEFIGDSWSCGYGNEGVTHGNCPNLAAVSNADRAFPVFLAEKLRAQYHVTAVSGDTMPQAFERTLFSRPDSKWDPARWVPDVVVLRLGVNDHSTQPAPAEKDFVEAYARFLKRLRNLYPKAEVFCFSDEGWPDYKPRILKALEERRKAGEKRVYWVGNRGFSPSELGCDWHPSVKAHWELAEVLEQAIRPVTGWNEINTPTPTPTEVPLKDRPTATPTGTPVVIPLPPEG